MEFTSRECEVFVKAWGIDHITSSPNYQQANGKAESAVKLVKAVMEKCVNTRSDQYLTILELRKTSIPTGSDQQHIYYKCILHLIHAPVFDSFLSCSCITGVFMLYPNILKGDFEVNLYVLTHLNQDLVQLTISVNPGYCH